MLVGVRVVVGAEDGPPPLGAALLRFIAYFASAAPFTLGFVMAGLRRDKRALHDLIAGTRVERLEEARGCRAAAGREFRSGRRGRRVIPTAPLRVRNRLAEIILAALEDAQARRQLAALGEPTNRAGLARARRCRVLAR